MCHINWPSSEWEFPDSFLDIRASPRLAWVAPVDVVELGASMEAYCKQLRQVHTLRLCHRFREGPLSQLPQEILDYIISHLHYMEKTAIQPKWKMSYACFQGTCTKEQHFPPHSEAWWEAWNAIIGDDELDPDDYSEEEKASMVEDWLMDDANFCLEWSWELHHEGLSRWLDMLCSCKKSTEHKDNETTFAQLNQVRTSLYCFMYQANQVPDFENSFRCGGDHSPRGAIRQHAVVFAGRFFL